VRVKGSQVASIISALVVALGVACMAADTNTRADELQLSDKAYPVVQAVAGAQPIADAIRQAYSTQTQSQPPVSAQQAYRNLTTGNAGLVLGPAPTNDDITAAKSAGVEFEVIPLVVSPLVILADANNPVDSLTTAQLAGIYTGTITDWAQVGGSPGPITAYQRPANSASRAGLVDLVTKGAVLANPPGLKVATGSGLVDAVASFSGQPGGLGYSYDYYVMAVWGDLTPGPSGNVKLLKVDGVAPTPETITSGRYPLTTAYSVVMRRSEPAGSPARQLVGAMLSAQGRTLLRQTGYVPVDQAGLPAVTPAPPVPPGGGLANRDQVYQFNPMTMSSSVQYVSGGTGRCAAVARADLKGLRDVSLQQQIMSDFRGRQDQFLKQFWGVERLSDVDSCNGTDIELAVSEPADFGNVLSLMSSWRVPGRSADSGYNVAATLNVRLDTGAELRFSDLFVPGASVPAMINAEAPASAPQADEQQVLSWIEAYRKQPDQPFTFTATSARLYLPGPGSSRTGIAIPYASRWQDVAVFDLASGVSGLFSTDPTRTACPVLTYRSAGYCWDEATAVAATAQVTAPAQTIEISLGLAQADQWQFTGHSDGFAGDPQPASGTGPAVVTLSVSGNDTGAARDLWAGLQVTNPETGHAYRAQIQVSQAAVPGMGVPVILKADTDYVSGAVPLPFEPGTRIQVTWPDGTTTVTDQVSADGAWSVATPEGGLDLGGRVLAVAVRPDGSVSQPGVLTVGTPTPDPQVSQLTVSGPVQAVLGSCGGPSTTTQPSVALTTTVLDTLHRPVPDLTVGFEVTGGLRLTQPYVTTDADGVATATALPDPAALTNGGQATVRARILVNGMQTDVAGSPAVVPVKVRSAKPAPTMPLVSLDNPNGSLPADGASAYTASVRWVDGCGQPLAGSQVEFSIDGAAQLDVTQVTLDSTGAAQLRIVDMVAETVVLRGRVSNTPDARDVEQYISFAPAVPDATQSSLKVADQLVTIPCGSGGSTTVTASVKDVDGHPLLGEPVRFSVDGQAELSQAEAQTNNQGVAEATVSNVAGETVTVRAVLKRGDEWVDLADAPVSVSFFRGCVASESAVRFTVSDGVRVANGQDSFTLTLYTRDANGGPVKGLADRFVFTPANPAVAVGPLTDAGNGSYTTTVTSTEPGTASVDIALRFPDGTTRYLANAPVSLEFVPFWAPSLTATISGNTLTVEVGTSVAGAPVIGLAGQSRAIRVDAGSSPVAVTTFTEVRPGVYTAGVAANTSGEYTLVVSWQEPGEDAPITVKATKA